MIKKDLLPQIKNLLEKYPDGISFTPLEILTLYLLHLHKEEDNESYYLHREIINIAIENAIRYLKEYEYPTPFKTDTVLDSLIKKKALLFSATERNTYYLSELTISILNGLFSKEINTVSDVESNLNAIYITLKSLEHAEPHDIISFFRHTFIDLIKRIDKR